MSTSAPHLQPELRDIRDRWLRYGGKYNNSTVQQMHTLASVLHSYRMGFGATHAQIEDLLVAFDIIDPRLPRG